MKRKPSKKKDKKSRRETPAEKDLLEIVYADAVQQVIKEEDQRFKIDVEFGESRDGSGSFTFEAQQQAIKDACDDLCKFLQGKNKSYQGSAFRDVMYKGRKIQAEETIDVRIVDKIRRLQSEDASFEGEDSENDLLGYLLLQQALKRLRGGG